MLACTRLALHKGKDMSEVKRYVWAGVHGLAEQQNGNWVSYIQYAALQQKLDAVLAENVMLKGFGNKLNDMHNNLNGEGTGIQGRAEVACQQVALGAAMEEFDAIKTPATDTLLNAVRAEGVEMVRKHPAISLCSLTHICEEITAQLRAVTDTTSSQYESLAGGK